MDAKGVMNSDVETLEEKLQILRAKMSEEEYETIRREIDEIRKLGVDLPDSGYMSNVADIIKKLVDLEVDNFSDKDFKKAIKEVKKEGFLAKLEYIKLCAREGKDVSQIFSVVGQYWEAIKGTFDAFEVSEVERKLEEVKLEILLKKVQTSKTVNLSEAEGINYLLLRERLQDLLANETIGQEKKLLIKSWLGESIDMKTGKVDSGFVKKLLVDKEIWEVLSGVKGVEVNTNQERQISQTNEEARESKPTQALIALGESKRRAEQIAKLSEKYHIPLKKFDLHKMQWDMPLHDYAIYILRYKRFGKTKYKWIGETEASMLRQAKIKRLETKRPLNKEVVAVVFNNGVTKISARGHAYQDTLEDVVFPDNLKSIGKDAFYKTGLKELVISGTVEEIDESAFACSYLERVTIPGSVKKIGDNAFAYNKRLKEVILREGLEEIGGGAFLETALEKIDIPGNVKKIGDNAFAYNKRLKEVILREGLEEIGGGAFLETALEKIYIPGSVKSIENRTFAGSSLEEVNFGEGVEKIEYRAFYNTKLRKVIFPQTIKIIGTEAFCSSPIFSVSVPSGVEYSKEFTFPEITRITEIGSEEKTITQEEDARLRSENEELRKENDELKRKVETLEKKIAEFEKSIKVKVRKSKAIDR